MTFELNTLAIADEGVLHLTHPVTGVPLYAPVKKGEDAESKPVQIVLKSTASQSYRRAVDAMMKKAAKRGKREATPEEMREQSVEFLVALSVRADNLTLNGETLDNAEAFRKLYSNDSFGWIKEQVNTFVGSVDGFLSA
jgi:hypothetical protein